MKTKYISIEGGDGSGKSTLVTNLHNYYLSKNKNILLTKEFGSTHDKFCQELREFALADRFNINEKAGQILFASIIMQHQEKVIKPAIGKYEIILSDRGPYSNYTYGPVHKVEQKFINSLFDLIYKDAHWPDLSIFINTPAELANKRRMERSPELFIGGGIDRIEAKGLEFQKQVIENFLKISKKDKRLSVINVTEDMSPIDILNQAVALIDKKLG